MLKAILVDTSALVAYFVPKDERHRKAKEGFAELERLGRRLVTTSDVFDETVTLIRKGAGHRVAVDVGEDLLGEEMMDLVIVDDELRKLGWEVFKAYRDRGFSFTDCTSLATLRNFGWTEIFTFDEEFRRVGVMAFPSTK